MDRFRCWSGLKTHFFGDGNGNVQQQIMNLEASSLTDNFFHANYTTTFSKLVLALDSLRKAIYVILTIYRCIFCMAMLIWLLRNRLGGSQFLRLQLDRPRGYSKSWTVPVDHQPTNVLAIMKEEIFSCPFVWVSEKIWHDAEPVYQSFPRNALHHLGYNSCGVVWKASSWFRVASKIMYCFFCTKCRMSQVKISSSRHLCGFWLTWFCTSLKLKCIRWRARKPPWRSHTSGYRMVCISLGAACNSIHAFGYHTLLLAGLWFGTEG